MLLDRGLGVGFPDVDDIGGPTATGGTFDLTYDAKTEFHVVGTLGTTYHFTSDRKSVGEGKRVELGGRRII